MLPEFYQPIKLESSVQLQLDEDTSRHIVQVLRMHPGEQVVITNGQGQSGTATIVRADKRKCLVDLDGVVEHSRRQPFLYMAVAFTKHAGRNEWLLEKITEMGVHSIIPIITKRTVRDKIRYDRWNNILAAAMIQSQQYYLPHLEQAVSLSVLLDQYKEVEQKFVAHCDTANSRTTLFKALHPGKHTLMLIGPEGDFSPEEIAECAQAGCQGISLGQTRLRTETAAMSACAYFNMVNDETV